MTKQIKEPSANVIELDKKKIDEQLSQYGDYYSRGIKIKNGMHQINKVEDNLRKEMKNISSSLKKIT